MTKWKLLTISYEARHYSLEQLLLWDALCNMVLLLVYLIIILTAY